jgi:hypothetical protein
VCLPSLFGGARLGESQAWTTSSNSHAMLLVRLLSLGILALTRPVAVRHGIDNPNFSIRKHHAAAPQLNECEAHALPRSYDTMC